MLAATKWKGIPKFNSPTMKAELVKFAAEVAPQCAMPEVGFNEEGIMKHVQSYFNEQRRYKRHKSDYKVTFLVNKFCFLTIPRVYSMHLQCCHALGSLLCTWEVSFCRYK